MEQVKKVIAYKIVRYTYGKKHDLGLLIAGFDTKEEAENKKLQLIEETKFNSTIYIYQIEDVYQHFNFISFLLSEHFNINI